MLEAAAVVGLETVQFEGQPLCLRAQLPRCGCEREEVAWASPFIGAVGGQLNAGMTGNLIAVGTTFCTDFMAAQYVGVYLIAELGWETEKWGFALVSKGSVDVSLGW